MGEQCSLATYRSLPLTSTCFISLQSAVRFRRAEQGRGVLMLTNKEPLIRCLEQRFPSVGMYLRITWEAA